MINFFKKKNINKTVEEEEWKHHKIIISGNDTISLGSMVLENKMTGDFYAQQVIVIDTDAFITGAVVATEVVVKGRVKGDIVCVGNLLIEATAIIDGSISAKIAEIESGAIIKGNVSLADTVQMPLLQEKIKEAQRLTKEGVVPTVAVNKVAKKEDLRTDESFRPVVNEKKVREEKEVKAIQPKKAPKKENDPPPAEGQPEGWW